jgi:PKD repeat protein
MKRKILFSLLFSIILSSGTFAQAYLANFTKVQTSPNNIAFTSTSTGTTGAMMYSWNFGDSVNSGTTTTPQTTTSYQYYVPGIYTVCLTIWDSTKTPFVYSHHCDTVKVTGTLICNFYGTADTVLASCSTCADAQSTAHVWGGTAPYTYTWSPSGGNAVTASHLLPGTYTVCVHDSKGCSTCMTTSLSYSANCRAHFTWAQTNPNVIQFTSTDTAKSVNTSYFWNFGDNFSSSLKDPSHTYLIPGTYYVSKTISDSSVGGICSNQVGMSITVTGTPICTLSYQMVSVPASCNTCADGADTLLLSWASAPYTYSWSTGSTYPILTGLTPGTYSVCVTDVHGCMVCKTNVVSYTSGPHSCTSNFTIAADTAHAGNYTVYNLATGTGPLRFDWNWGDNTFHDTIAAPSHTYAGPGFQYICLTIYDATGCTSSFCDTITTFRLKPQPAGVHTTIHVIRPLNLGIRTNETSGTCSIYPNPSRAGMTVSYVVKESSTTGIAVFDLLGKELLVLKSPAVQMPGSYEQKLDAGVLEPGIYLLQMKANGGIDMKRFVIIR